VSGIGTRSSATNELARSSEETALGLSTEAATDLRIPVFHCFSSVADEALKTSSNFSP
jgi:hypothetical protein